MIQEAKEGRGEHPDSVLPCRGYEDDWETEFSSRDVVCCDSQDSVACDDCGQGQDDLEEHDGRLRSSVW